ncbi:MAG: HAD family hydrolase, partial [Muribaculaceae bacterium]|nr:HAD family hydrolase [Muribaculaceae bacterium]
LELLTWLKENEVPTVLVTSSNEKKMRHLREELPEAESFFTHIVTGDKVSRSKPDPEGYLLGAKLIGRRPQNCVVFEDYLQGVKAGRAAGAFIVGVAGTLDKETIEPFSDIIVDSLAEIDGKSVINILKRR